jgi:hypothetical protein
MLCSTCSCNSAVLPLPQSLGLSAYYGFNLMVGDLHSRQVAYVCNRDPQGPRLLGPGHYGKCSHALKQACKQTACMQPHLEALSVDHNQAHLACF